MNRIVRNLVLTAAVAASVLAPLASASADEWRHGRDRWDHRHYRHDGGGNNVGVAIGAGVVGLAVGALIANSANPADVDDRRYEDRRYIDGDDYDRDAPRRPHVVTYGDNEAVGVEPWSRAWFRYCSERYRTFDSETGTFRGNDGRDHFCTAG